MALDLATIGFTTSPYKLAYDWRNLATYALGVGARRDELPFLYEGTEGGMKVLPSFGVVPAHGPVVEVLARTGGNMAMIVHGAQTVRSFGAIPDRGTLETVGICKNIYDMKKFAQVIIETRTSLDGQPAYETTWSIIYRGEGGFGGERPPADDAPSAPKDRPGDWEFEQATSPEQALLYRISGDQNPLHADPVFAERVGFTQGPILHGLCTFGYLARAVVKHACGGEPTRLKTLSAQFRKPVWPGDTFQIQGFALGDGRVALTTRVKERDEAVLGSAYAVISQ
jgi:acyl dehydratase